MTTLIPKYCIDTNPASLRLHKVLYDQLGPNYRVIQHLDSPVELPGSLLWIQHDKQSLFLYLSQFTQDELSLQKDNKDSVKDLLKSPEVAQLLKLQGKLLPKQLHSHKVQLAPFLVIFSNLDNGSINVGLKTHGLFLVGKDYLENNNLGSLIYKLLGKHYSRAIHSYIRHIFCPETLTTTHNSIELSHLSNHLLNNDQETAMKADIVLPREKRRVKNCNLTGINGGACSGKTETLVRRAKLLRNFYLEPNILLLTINKLSQKSLKDSYLKISPDDKKTDIFSFYQWCQEKLKAQKQPVFVDDVLNIIEAKICPKLARKEIDLPTFLHELDYIHGRVIFYEKDYIKVPQTDQPYILSKEQYSHIWRAVLLLKNELALSNLILWSELPQLLWDSLQKNPFSHNYDHILVDDSHFFPPIAFELFKKVLKPNTGQLFVTQDPNQGLINPCVLWKDTGLDLRGHSTRLNSYHKVNPYILNATNAFYLNRLPEQTDKHILQDLPLSKNKPIPELLHFHSVRDEENRLINEIKNHVKIGQQLNEILIITMNHKRTQQLAELLKKTLNVSIDLLSENKFQPYQQRKGIGICSIVQAQGSQAQHVYIFGVQQLFDMESNVDLSTRENQVLWRENTQKLSYAMSRARKKLTLFMTMDTIPEFFISPHLKIPTANTAKKADICYL